MPLLLPLLLRMLLHLLLVRSAKNVLKSYQGLIHSIAVQWGALKSWLQALFGSLLDKLKVNMMIHTIPVNPRFYKPT
jgi:hypothetical protein